MGTPHPDEVSQIVQAWTLLPPLVQHALTALGSMFAGLVGAYAVLGRSVSEIKGMVKTLHDDHDKFIVDHEELQRLKRRFARFEKRPEHGPLSQPKQSLY